jgi:hypothetical protein
MTPWRCSGDPRLRPLATRPRAYPLPLLPRAGGIRRRPHRTRQSYQAWGGAGEIDVCPNCRMEPYVVEGIEACGCTVVVFALELGKVA